MAGANLLDDGWDDIEDGSKPGKSPQRPLDSLGWVAFVFGMAGYLMVVLNILAVLNVVAWCIAFGFDWSMESGSGRQFLGLVVDGLSMGLAMGLPTNVLGLASSGISLLVVRLYGHDQVWRVVRPALWINAATTALGLAARLVIRVD